MQIAPVVYADVKKSRCYETTVALVVFVSLTACNIMTTEPNPIDTVQTNQLPAGGARSNCLLPSQVRMRGSNFTFLAPRQVVEVSPKECKTRGGEIVSRI